MVERRRVGALIIGWFYDTDARKPRPGFFIVFKTASLKVGKGRHLNRVVNGSRQYYMLIGFSAIVRDHSDRHLVSFCPSLVEENVVLTAIMIFIKLLWGYLKAPCYGA